MRNLGYYNGEIGLIEDMKVPMTDRGLYFGDGIYDAAYTRNHIIYALDVGRMYTRVCKAPDISMIHSGFSIPRTGPMRKV